MKKVLKVLKSSVAALLAINLIFLACICYIWFGVLRGYYNVPNDNKYVTAYDTDSGLVSDDILAAFGDEEAYALGVNEAGNVVFQHPHKAYKKALKECKEAKKAIKKEYDLKHMSRTWYIAYINAGEQFAEQEKEDDLDLAKQALKLSYVLSIYSNSFNKTR
jgi:hypothetical protein